MQLLFYLCSLILYITCKDKSEEKLPRIIGDPKNVDSSATTYVLNIFSGSLKG